MSTTIAAATYAAAATTHTSGLEATTFWILGPIAVIAAFGMVFSKKAVHAALLLAVDMLCLAVFYAAQDAPFLAFVQVIVYTGAVMMLFLFVLMLVGVDASDSLIETLKGQRLATAAAAIGFAVLLCAGLGQATIGSGVGLTSVNAAGNPQGLAELVFTRYVFAFEATSALLITAALGAMVLAHRERTGKRSQRDLMQQRFRSGAYPGPLPPPGVYARHNAVDTPALLPDGSPAPNSVSPLLEPRRTPIERSELEGRTETDGGQR